MTQQEEYRCPLLLLHAYRVSSVSSLLILDRAVVVEALFILPDHVDCWHGIIFRPLLLIVGKQHNAKLAFRELFETQRAVKQRCAFSICHTPGIQKMAECDTIYAKSTRWPRKQKIISPSTRILSCVLDTSSFLFSVLATSSAKLKARTITVEHPST